MTSPTQDRLTQDRLTQDRLTQDRVAARERTLCGIYAAVLCVDSVPPGEGFFDAGGDSVLALQVVSRAREAGLELSVRDLFEHQSASRLAPRIAEAPAAASTAATGAGAAPAALTRHQLDELGLDDLDAEFDELAGSAAEGEQAWNDETGWETGR